MKTRSHLSTVDLNKDNGVTKYIDEQLSENLQIEFVVRPSELFDVYYYFKYYVLYKGLRNAE
jgi:hypothetical protein